MSISEDQVTGRGGWEAEVGVMRANAGVPRHDD
jgi:hypothetical protein